MKTLENKTIKLRALEPEDIDTLYIWENNTQIWNVSNTLVPFSKYILKEYIKNSNLDIFATKQLRLVIETKKNNTTVGLIDFFDFDPYHLRAGIGILINNEEDRRKHYATEALETFIKYGFEVLLLNQIYCNIIEDNEKSIKLFKSMGFEQTGLKKSWVNTSDGFKDVLFFQRGSE